MHKNYLVGAFGFLGLVSYIWPVFHGFFSDNSDMSIGDTRIIGAIFIVGAGIIWCMKDQNNPNY
jgi:drug/metabolite transporter (DMT)-like permease